MATVLERPPEMTLADLFNRFGPMPAARIRVVPQPGTANVRDVLAIHRREKKPVVPGFKVKVAEIFSVLDEL